MIQVERFSQFQQKEVINLCDGNRLGFACDLEFDVNTGKILALIVPQEGGMWNFFSKNLEYRIPWNCIRRIGDDVILVEMPVDSILHP